MGPGVALVIVGAIFSFAVRKELPGIDIQTVGVILMLAGIGLVAHARQDRVHQQEITRVEEPADQTGSAHNVVRETTTERDVK